MRVRARSYRRRTPEQFQRVLYTAARVYHTAWFELLRRPCRQYGDPVLARDDSAVSDALSYSSVRLLVSTHSSHHSTTLSW